MASASWSMDAEARDRHTLSEAYELGDRFPDLQDDEVFDRMAEIRGKRIHPESIVGRAIIIAYEGDYDAALHYITAALGKL